MRRRIAGAFLLILILTLAGCAYHADREQNTEIIEITLLHGWSGDNPDCVAMREIFEDFNLEHEDIHLNFLTMPSGGEVVAQAEDMYTVGKVPDIISISGSAGQVFYSYVISCNYALDLTPYLQADPEFAEDVSPLIQKVWTTDDGQLYNVTDALMMSGYWYSQRMFEQVGFMKPPETWEEFEELCNRLNRMFTDEQFQPMAAYSGSIMDLFDAYLASETEDAPQLLHQYAKTGIDFDSFLMEQGMEHFVSFCKACEIRVENAYFVEGLDAFINGRAAMMLGGVWNNIDVSANPHARFASFPGRDGNAVACVSAGLNYIVGKTGDSEKEAACVEFLKYMLRDDTQKRIAESTGQMPSNPNILLAEQNETNQLLAGAVEIANSAPISIERSIIQWGNDEDAKDYLVKHLNRLIDGEVRAEDVLAQMRGLLHTTE